MRALRLCWSLVLAGATVLAQPPVPTPVDDPTPQTLDEFRAAAAKVLEDTGVPGAGLALVHVDGTEWAGGIGWADRDKRIPVTAETHFRAGSISKTFVALALVQLYEDGKLDLDADVAALLPEVTIDNPWAMSTPVTVRHLLEHTAGFDDMHFNETYVVDDAPDLSLEDVLRRNPASRRVRWRPGTRMSYSNPGYGVAGLLVEKVSGTPFDEYVEERIFRPLEMTTSSFRHPAADDSTLAAGYSGPNGPPVPTRRIYLRPAGALHTSPAELAHLVEALLGWGERGNGGYVVDPEYLSNMEWPRTTLASRAGVRPGYGLGIFSTIALPYPVLGHNGGIEGFLSTYGYSPSRDVGFVVLLNATHAPSALTRLSSLAIRYLKRDLEPPRPPSLAVTADTLRAYEGYYRDSSPRNEFLQPVRSVMDGRTVRLDGDHLVLDPDFGASLPLVAVENGVFRRPHEIDGSLAFTEDADGRAVLTGPGIYAERTARWPVWLLRAALAVAAIVVVLAPLAAFGRWILRARRGERAAGVAVLGVVWCAALALIGLAAWGVSAPPIELATPSPRALALFVATAAYPVAAIVACAAAVWSVLGGRPGGFGVFAVATAVAHTGLAIFLAVWGLIGVRTWVY